MRCVVAAFIVLAWFVPLSPRSTEDKSTKSVQDNPKSNQSRSNTPPTPEVKSNATQETKEPSHGIATDHPESPVRVVSPISVNTLKDRWDIGLVVFTGLLVLVGLFQILFLWRTVEATNDNAKAARDNALALMDAERAWVVVNVSEIPLPVLDNVRRAELIVTNHGRTIAFVTGLWVESAPDIQQLRVMVTQRSEAETIGQYVVPNESIVFPVDGSLNHIVSNPNAHIIVGGVLWYSDVHGRGWWTRFCYRGRYISGPREIQFERIPNEGYNSYG